MASDAKKILLVEDEKAIRDAVAAYLEREGYWVVEMCIRDNYVYSLQVNRRLRAGGESMTAERLDIGEALATEWLPEVHTAIFASATMTVSKSFEHFNQMCIRDRELACAAHKALGCLGISRSDFIVSEDGPVILETNTIPGMTDTSLYPDEIRHTDDMTFPQVCDSLIRMGLRRAGIAC